MSNEYYLGKIHQFLDATAFVVVGPHADVPALWQPYLNKDRMARLAHIDAEFHRLQPWLPKTIEAIKTVTKDAFIISYNDNVYGPRLARVFNQLGSFDAPPDSQLHALMSYQIVPAELQIEKNRIFLDRCPEPLAWMYETMFNGLEDLYDAGLHRLQQLVPISEPSQGYDSTDWYDEFVLRHSPDYVYTILHNGGAVSALIDLNDVKTAKSDDPLAIWVDVKDGTFDRERDFWDFIDTLMSIIISGR
jgi:hypothetical protein